MAEIIHRSENARLITRASADRAGLGDYTIKQDFRRDLDQEIRREGYDYFWPNVSGAFALDPGDQPFPETAPINLVHLARRPNGEHALIVGSKERLWRFVGIGSGNYYEGSGSGNYFENDNETPPDPLAYYAANSSAWELIGSGFSPAGHRWEALNINGYTVLNNGVDLPMTFRLEEGVVVPIHELREQGVISVGTIGETSGILMVGDITEAADAETLVELMNPVGDIDSGTVTADQNLTVVRTLADFFVNTPGFGTPFSHVGRFITWEDGRSAKILSITNPREVVVDLSDTQPHASFTLRNKGGQAGSDFSGLVLASVPVTGAPHVVTATGPFFTADMVGDTIRFPDGFSATITVFTSSTVVQVNTAPVDAVVNRPFWVVSPLAFQLFSSANFFTADMVGRTLLFDGGQSRKITAVVSPREVTVDTDGPVDDFFELNNPASYLAYTGPVSKTNRIQYRCAWANPDEPRRWSSTVPVSVTAGSQTATLLFPARSFEAGQEVVIVGAGEAGGNLTTTILSVNGSSILLADQAVTTVDAGNDPDEEDGFMQRSDAQGAITGFEDLQDDSSGILRILALGENTLIIYKDTCNFTAFFTGDPAAPFDLKRIKLPEAMTLHYRWTLCDVAGQFHVFAGANTFYKFDLSSRVPQVIMELDAISDKFFRQVRLADTDRIYAADNAVTNELFFWFPSTAEEKALVLDYKQSSASTTSMVMSAAATVKKPVLGTLAGATTDLFVMGTEEGVVLVYGKSEEPEASWGGAKEIFFRRQDHPFNAVPEGYDSVLRSGWGDFGQPGNVKDLLQYVLYLASQSPDCPLTVKIEGVRNSSAPPVKLLEVMIPSPETENLLPMFFRDNYFRWTVTITGTNNPCRIVQHSFLADLVTSQNHERRPTP